MIGEKRALSIIIASVLLILITISSVTLLMMYVIPFTQRSLDETECFDYRDYFAFDDALGYNCHDDVADKYFFSVRARANPKGAEKVEGFSVRLIKQDGSSASTLSLKKDGTVTGGALTLVGGGPLNIPVSGGTYSALSYEHASLEAYDWIEIYPMIEGGKICQKSDSLRFREGC